MHRLIGNELRLDFSLFAAGPLSIQARDSESPRFVRAVHPEADEPSVYIPAATLKGALRSGAEQILRGAAMDCCDPEHPCAGRDTVNRARQAHDNPAIYRALCGACRIFGSKVMRSHLTITDCFPAQPLDAAPRRDASNNAGAAEVVQNETFYGTLSLRNFERWQVGLLALVLARLNIAEIQLGGNRSAGMGCVTVRYRRLNLVYPTMAPGWNQEALQTYVHGVGQLLGAGNPYGFVYPDIADAPDLPESAALETGFGYVAVTIAEKAAGSREPDEQETESEEAVPDELDEADRIHGLIDSVLTEQALAWAGYVRTHKSR